MDTVKKQFNYNTVLIVLCFFIIMLGLGLWAPKGLFVKPITDALGIERSLYTLADTLRYATTAIVSLFFGRLHDRFGTKRLVCGGFLFMAASALFYAVSEGLPLFYIGGILNGVGLSFAGTTIVAYVVGRACKRNRGKVMGVVLAANGLGSAVFSPIMSALINEEGNPFGYRNAFYMMAAIFASMCVVLLLLFREPTEAEGESEAPARKRRGVAWPGISCAEARRRGYFYVTCVVIFLTGLILQGLGSCNYAYLGDLGMSPAFIAMLSGMGGLLLASAKIVDGILYDGVGLRVTVTLNCLSGVAAVICLLYASDAVLGRILAVGCAVLLAFALPLETVMVPIYASDFFGERDSKRILGILMCVNQAGLALGPTTMNVFYDVSGSYRLVFWLCVPVLLLTVSLFQLAAVAAARTRRAVLEREEKA